MTNVLPCPLKVDDARVAQELMKETDGSMGGVGGIGGGVGGGRRRRDGSLGRRTAGMHQGDRWGDTYDSMPVKKMVAIYDYDPQELSPNVDSEVRIFNVHAVEVLIVSPVR